MKTFETMKRDIPEGATHHGIYGCDTDVYFKEDDGVFLEWKHDNWSISSFSHHKWVKPIQTESKYRYEKVELERAWIAAKNHEEKTIEFWRKSDIGDAVKGIQWKAIQSPSEAAQYHFDLYRRVEISERDEFIEAYALAVQDDISNVEDIAGMLFDSGKFKLVD